MSLVSPRPVALAASLVATLWASAALAAPCGRPDVDVTFPPNGATDVPQNARLSAHYAAPALYLDEGVELFDQQGESVAVESSFDEAESVLRAIPLAPLDAGHYELAFPGLRGVGSGGVGLGKRVRFFVQNTRDAAPPRFAGLGALDWDLARDRDPCVDSLEDRFVFTLGLGEASDDAATELLAVLVFETRDPSRAGQLDPVQIALRGMPVSRELEVRRAAESAGKTCFAAVLQDLAGNLSDGADKQVCVATKQPPFFEGCALVRPPLAGSPAWPWAALAAAVTATCARQRRGARAASHRQRAAR